MKNEKTRSGWLVQSRISPTAVLDDCFITAVGFLTCVRLRFVGDIYIGELLMAISLPLVLLLRKRRNISPPFLVLFVFLGLWFLGQVFTDAYREVEFADRMRGMAAILFLAVEIAFLASLLAESRRRTIIFLAARAIGSLAMARVQPMRYALEDPWKFGYSSGVIILAVLISCFFYARRKYAFALVVLVGIMMVNLLQNFRSAFLDVLVAAVLVLPIVPERIGRLRILPSKGNVLRIAIIVALTLGAVWSAGRVIRSITQSGYLSAESQEKNESEAQAGNLLLGGRPEVFVGLRAAMDSPIIGHGSWARDMKYIEMQSDLMEDYGMQVDLADAEAEDLGVIPAHSHIVGAWVWAGVLGAAFWAYAIWLVIRAIIVVSIYRPPLAPIYAFLFVVSFWDILFSPFGGTERVSQALALTLAISLIERNTKPIHLPAPWRRIRRLHRSLA
jgi:hypothetical protein